MEGEVDAEVAPPIYLYNQSLPGLFSEARPMPRKRDWPWGNPGFHHVHQQQQQQGHHWRMGSGLLTNSNANSWNPKMWEWDSLRFSAKPLNDSPEVLVLGSHGAAGVSMSGGCSEHRENGGESGKALVVSQVMENDCENLALKLGGGGTAVEEHGQRQIKRVRSGSPGNATGYPMCQVDDCKADLSNAKDYHRRHKVCELHSKTAKALVGRQMQRFCQQCSRFHPLTEFDEGKRSCRRRLAGHNRRRRKTPSEDAPTNPSVPGNQDGKASGDIFLGNMAGKTASTAAVAERDRLIQIINKIGSLPNPNPPSKTQIQRCFDLNVSQNPQQSPSEQPSLGSRSPNTPSTLNLLAVLSTALGSSHLGALASLSQENSDGGGSSKNREPCRDSIADSNLDTKLASSFPPSLNSSELPVEMATLSLPLQLFSSPEDESRPKLGSAIKYPSSESSNPMDDGSPSSSPPVAKRLFPQHLASARKTGSVLIGREDNAGAETSMTCGWIPPLELFKFSDKQHDNQRVSNFPYSGGYSSSSGSPSSSNCDTQERTGRIVFKLFEKDPSSLPGTLRSEILNWLSHSPSDIESYIRPGCVVLSVYLCMTSIAWHELEEDLQQRVKSLVNGSGSRFWRNLRFLVRTSGQIISHKDGKIRVCTSSRTSTAPELTSVSPIAVVSGEETTLILKGRNLNIPGNKIYCTCNGGYSSKEVLGSVQPGTMYDDSSSESFNLPEGLTNSYGRYFIEVDNGFSGNIFPVLIADATICMELRSLELEIDIVGIQSRENVLHFLNELGWLFQRKNHPELPFVDFATSRFKCLFAFSVQRDFSALVKMLLDILVERCYENDSVLKESLDLVLDLQILSQAVKKKCRKMVELLLSYNIKSSVTKGLKMYIFPPNSTGPSGLTPLHVAASMQDAEDLVDALTNDPQEIGLSCWASALDDSGHTPWMYASSTNNAYNMLVSRKLADKRNSRVSIMISSCARCALAESRLARISHRRGLLRRPYILSMLTVAAVCVCVCLFFRGAPFVGSIAPFEWENLNFGPD
ncbi:Squamosa promoter-binding-like protein 15 [Platanthera zijinensis]|uniref:Squamosa promoter-binding-like protein 15 n=1 Tax=Platanthera zijinensis TaxID=2320716 RepID=A0AAP0C2W7_9ASPA